MTKPTEVHVRHPMGGNEKSPRFVSPELARQMVSEGRAVYPGDSKQPPLKENGDKP